MSIPSKTVLVGGVTEASQYDTLYNNAVLANTGGTAGGSQSIPGEKTFQSATVFQATATFSGTVDIQGTATIPDIAGDVAIGGNVDITGDVDIIGALNIYADTTKRVSWETTGRSRVYRGTIETYRDVAAYYTNTATGMLLITMADIGNLMMDVEINVFSYRGVMKVHFHGYTYTSQTDWFSPHVHVSYVNMLSANLLVQHGYKTADGTRVLGIGSTAANWTAYPHCMVERVSIGYGGTIGNWSIELVTDTTGYTLGVTPARTT